MPIHIYGSEMNVRRAGDALTSILADHHGEFPYSIGASTELDEKNSDDEELYLQARGIAPKGSTVPPEVYISITEHCMGTLVSITPVSGISLEELQTLEEKLARCLPEAGLLGDYCKVL
jgi:hypothetical protein